MRQKNCGRIMKRKRAKCLLKIFAKKFANEISHENFMRIDVSNRFLLFDKLKSNDI